MDSGLKSSQLLYGDDTNQIVPAIQPDLLAEIDEPEVEGPEVEGPEVEGPEVEGPEVEGPEVEGPEVEGPAVDEPAVVEPAVVEPAVVEPAVEGVAVNAPRIAFKLASPKARPGPTLLAFQEEDDNALTLTLPLLDIPPLVEPTQDTGKLAKPRILTAVEIGLERVLRVASDTRIRNMRTSVASYLPVYREGGFDEDIYSLKKRLVRLMWEGATVMDALCSAEQRATLSTGDLDEERSKCLRDSIKFAAKFCVVTGASLDDVLTLSVSDIRSFGSVQAS